VLAGRPTVYIGTSVRIGSDAGYNTGVAKIRKKHPKKKKKEPWMPSIQRRKSSRYSAGELFMAGLGLFVLILFVGLIVTSLL
jgi:hypothetical protein